MTPTEAAGVSGTAAVTATAAAAGDPSALAALEAAYPFAVSVALGALIGMERERTRMSGGELADSMPGGIRTFPIAALLGCAVAWIAHHAGGGAASGVVVAVGIGAFALLVTAVYVLTSMKGDLSVTTEVALFLTFLLGVIAHEDRSLLAPALAVVTTIILSLREWLHDVARRMDEDDLFGALKLAAVSIVLLPLLPDQGLGPWQVWNPYKIGLLVVFISAIGFAGYVGVKLLGPGRGIAVAGLLGGIASSTASTVSFSAKSRETPEVAHECAVAIALAWGSMYVRLCVAIALVAPALARAVAVPLGATCAAGLVAAGVLHLQARRAKEKGKPEGTYRSPFRLIPALKFAVLFSIVLLVAKAAQEEFSSAGLYVAAVLTGFLDVDAIALSAAGLAARGQVAPESAIVAVFLAVAANTVSKAGMAAWLGAGPLRWSMPAVAAFSLAAGGAALAVTRGAGG